MLSDTLAREALKLLSQNIRLVNGNLNSDYFKIKIFS